MLLLGWLPRTRKRALFLAASAMLLITLVCQQLTDPPIRSLYFIPLLLSAPCISTSDLFLMGGAATLLSEYISPRSLGAGLLLRPLCTFLTYIVCGFLIRAMDHQRKASQTYAHNLSCQLREHEHAEQQLESLLRGVPAALLSLDPTGRVEFANEPLYELLGFRPPSLQGEVIDEYLPDLGRLRRASRLLHLGKTMIEGTGYKSTGEAFIAYIWVTSYGPPSASSITAVIFDESERFRERQESGLYSLTTSTRVIMGAFWHETRNLSNAMRILIRRIMSRPEMADAEELIGLRSLVDSLEKLAYTEQHPVSDHDLDTASIRVMLDHLRILTEPSLKESDVAVTWSANGEIPLVCGDGEALLQVFLNIVRNANRALQGQQCKLLRISVSVDRGRVIVSFTNSGPPVNRPELLFEPFQPGASERGLGLYVSRAIVKSFGGDLVYHLGPEGCCFAVVLLISQFWCGAADPTRTRHPRSAEGSDELETQGNRL